MKARYELLGSGTPTTNKREVEAEKQRELKRIAKEYNVTLEEETDEIPDYLHIHSFASQTGSFVNF